MDLSKIQSCRDYVAKVMEAAGVQCDVSSLYHPVGYDTPVFRVKMKDWSVDVSECPVSVRVTHGWVEVDGFAISGGDDYLYEVPGKFGVTKQLFEFLRSSAMDKINTDEYAEEINNGKEKYL